MTQLPVKRALAAACSAAMAAAPYFVAAQSLTPLAQLTVAPDAGITPVSAAPLKIEQIVITATTGAYRPSEKGASALAPTQASLSATQPQSIITREFIESSVAPTAEYSRVVNVAPSMSGDSANGPGLSETKTTMRGFSDDQYNITFDGIPWGDTNNPSHHSTSFFPASVLGGVVVERGPGNASNIGFATFGGSINLFSKKPLTQSAASVFGAYGTWNTMLLGASFESGKLASMGSATVQVNFQHLESDGYLTLNGIRSDNLMLKFQMPVGDNSTLTAFASANKIKYDQNDNSKGPTLAQAALYGRNFSLNADPKSFNFVGYNYTHKDTDFDYVRLASNWANEFATEATVYTYAYNNQTISSTDPTGLTAPGTKIGSVGNKNIPGIDKQNKYRVYGGIFKATKQFSAGLLRGGLWVEKSDTDRHQYDIDLTLGNVRDPRETKPTPVQYPSVLFDQQSKISNLQPFAEFEWEATPTTTITPGIKTLRITRSVDALVNQTTRTPQNASVNYHATLPFLTINQQLTKSIAAYGQYAKGFQIPDLKSFYIADPTKNSAEPQLSTNYQLGIVGKNRDFTWDVDAYRIEFKNKYVSNGLGGAAAAFVNVGGATYQGFEAQGSYMVIEGLALYSNGSINKATANDNGKTIAGAPRMTAAMGAIYSAGPWGGSLIFKRTGSVYQQDYDAAKPANYDFYRTRAYDNIDFGVSYTFTGLGLFAKTLKLQANVFNLANQQRITSISPGKVLAGDQYLYQAPRSFQVSARMVF
jgi:iron complex outermembrane recepter protein